MQLHLVYYYTYRMDKGIVKFYNVRKGFGFIRPEGVEEEGQDVFVHFTGLNPGTKLYEGSVVMYEMGEGPKGEVAVNVQLDPDAEQPEPPVFTPREGGDHYSA